MLSFLGQGVIGEFLAPTKSPGQQLHAAIEDGLNDKAMRLIHEERIDFNFPDPAREDSLPIHTACKSGNKAMVDALLQLGADVNAKDRQGSIPLHYAAKYSNIDMVKHLVAQGADVARRNVQRLTPYDVATNHVIRQYLLPLQLRAEPTVDVHDPLLAVHNPDAIRDYSNLPPPPTGGPPMPMAPPPSGGHLPYHPPARSGWTDPSVTRPIAADGFHCSVGDPELAAKYGHVKTAILPAVPPPGVVAGTGASLPPANPSAYSAFSAYNGRPMPRYVAYNAVDGTTAPYLPPPSQAYAAAPLQAGMGMQQQHVYTSPPPHPPGVQPVAPYVQQPQPQVGGYAAPATYGVPGAIPTLPSPSTIGAYAGAAHEADDDATPLDQSVTRLA